MTFCSVPDCCNEAHSGDLCGGHARRRARGRPVASALREPRTRWGRLTEAALAYADACSEDDAEYLRLARNLRRAAQAYGEPGPVVPEPAYGAENEAPHGAEGAGEVST